MKVFIINIQKKNEIAWQAGIKTFESFGCEGLASYLYDKASLIKGNEKAWKRLLDIVYENAHRPELLGFSEHVVFVGQKN